MPRDRQTENSDFIGPSAGWRSRNQGTLLRKKTTIFFYVKRNNDQKSQRPGSPSRK